MPVTLQDVITRVRSNLEESVAKFFSNDELANWVNDGLRDVARRSEALHTVAASITVSAGASLISSGLPTDIVRINRVEFVDGSGTQTFPLVAASYAELDQYWGLQPNQQSGNPVYYSTIGFPGGSGNSAFKIKIYPAPSAAGTLTIYYWKLPYRFTSGSGGELAKNLEIIEGWDDAIVLYCEWNAKRKDRNPEWQLIKAVYEEKLAELIEVTRAFHDQQGMIVTGAIAVPNYLYDWDD